MHRLVALCFLLIINNQAFTGMKTKLKQENAQKDTRVNKERQRERGIYRNFDNHVLVIPDDWQTDRGENTWKGNEDRYRDW